MVLGFSLAPQARVFGGFAVYAFAMGNIFPRIAEIKNAMGVGEGALGLGLIGAPVGTLIATTFGAAIIEKIGFRPALLILIPSIALFFAAASLAPNPLWFFFLVLPAGLAIGGLEIILNLETDRTEHLIGRRIMNRAHAYWSFGFFGSGLVSGAIAQTGLPIAVHLFAMVPLVALVAVFIFGRFSPAPGRPTAHGTAPKFAVPTPGILALVALSLSALALEGAYADWSSIYMTTLFRAEPLVAALALTLAALSQGLTRYFADAFVDRYSPIGVARVLLVVSAAGALVVFVARAEWQALFGFMLLGIGTSVIFPLAMSAAARRTDRPAAVNVAALAQIAFVTFLLAPPLLGFIAEHWGIAWAFGVGLPLVALSLAFSNALGEKPVAAPLE